jgi:hypothetical protein
MAEMHDLKTRLADLEAGQGINPEYPTRSATLKPTDRRSDGDE